MGNMDTNVYVKFDYDQLLIDKALGNLRKSRTRTTLIALGDHFRVPKQFKTLQTIHIKRVI